MFSNKSKIVTNCTKTTQPIHQGEEAYMGTRPVFRLELIKSTYGI